jgi:hypothetical protein
VHTNSNLLVQYLRKLFQRRDVMVLFIRRPSTARDSPAERSSGNYAKQVTQEDVLFFLETRRESAVHSVGSRRSCGPHLHTDVPSVENFGHFGPKSRTNLTKVPVSYQAAFPVLHFIFHLLQQPLYSPSANITCASHRPAVRMCPVRFPVFGDAVLIHDVFLHNSRTQPRLSNVCI